tara:strand:- start:632 stop:757 length:126 start_codon:yes stop_codon:yes gene_type:complete
LERAYNQGKEKIIDEDLSNNFIKYYPFSKAILEEWEKIKNK